MSSEVKRRDDYERVVFAEVLIPDQMDVFGDFHTKESVKNFAYGFMKQGFGIEATHNSVDRSDSLKVVESFLAREGDPDFIVGSWVVGLYIEDDVIWEGVLDGTYNGFSYQALVSAVYVDMVMPNDVVRVGVTEPSLEDGHVHDYIVILDDDGRAIVGGTSETNGHMHKIRTHTLTEEAAGHVHIYNFVKGSEGY